jgi:hypothetical protein
MENVRHHPLRPGHTQRLLPHVRRISAYGGLPIIDARMAALSHTSPLLFPSAHALLPLPPISIYYQLLRRQGVWGF